jgi:iron complex transport system substrate-binding protein
MSFLSLKYFLVILLFLPACSAKNRKVQGSLNEKADTGIIYAKRFNISEKEGYTVLTVINPWQGASGISQLTYLVKRGEKIPVGVDPGDIIFVPVEKIICMSTTYLAMISALGMGNTVKGISGANLIYDNGLREKVKRGEVADVGPQDNLNNELVVQISPDLIMVYGVGSESAGHLNKIREMGQKVLFNADYLEIEPLAKAEWIKVFGALFCREKEAQEVFSAIEKEYNCVKALVREKTTDRPTVMLGLPWKDTWYISPGNSFMSSLIKDAGGNYLWKEEISEISMPYGIENVFMKAQRADCWINISAVNSRDEIISVDSRLGVLPVFKSGNLYNNNNLVSPEGANDYWESGAISPQVILKDITAILHPGLFPGYRMVYYKKIN